MPVHLIGSDCLLCYNLNLTLKWARTAITTLVESKVLDVLIMSCCHLAVGTRTQLKLNLKCVTLLNLKWKTLKSERGIVTSWFGFLIKWIQISNSRNGPIHKMCVMSSSCRCIPLFLFLVQRKIVHLTV